MNMKECIRLSIKVIEQKLKYINRDLLQFTDIKDGSLTCEIRNSHNLYYYLQTRSGNKRSKQYLGKGNCVLVSKYKKKYFLEAKKKRLMWNRSILMKTVDKLVDESDVSVYDKLPVSYKNLPPDCYTDETSQELKEWAKEYERNPYPIPVDANTACDGTKTRSKGETIIYDDVLCSGIPNQYDPKIRRRGASGVYHNLYPDFLFLGLDGREIAWEHLGMTDVEDYANRLRDKIEEYLDCGFILGDNLILTSDNASHCTNEVMILDMIELVRTKVLGDKHEPDKPYDI